MRIKKIFLGLPKVFFAITKGTAMQFYSQLFTSAVSCAIRAGDKQSGFFQPLLPPRSTQIVVHRGLMSIAPENTIPAFEECIKQGFEWIEVDVRLTRDGQHVIIHDKNVDRTTNGSGPVSQITLEAIKDLDAGSYFAPRFAGTRIPTLKETLSLCKNKLNLNLDCKEADPTLLVNEILEAQMERQVVVAGSQQFLQAVEAASGGTVPTQMNFRMNPDVSAWTSNHRPRSLEIKHNSVTPGLISALKIAGVIPQVQCLGKDDLPQNWRELIDMEVDWLVTDYAENIAAEYAWKAIGQDRPVWISAHRGANAFAPENTIPAFQKAIDMGLDFIEIDVRTTRDEKMVILHDGSLARTTMLDKKVRDVDFSEVRSLSAGAWFGAPYAKERIPTPDEVFEMARGKIQFYVDFKDASPEALVESMRRCNVVDDCIIYGDAEEIAPVKALEPKIRLMPDLSDPNQVDYLVDFCHPYAFDAKWRILSEELIAHSHHHGVKVFSDSMGKHENMADYHQAMEWGIDCIQTDEPVILLRAIELYVRDHSNR